MKKSAQKKFSASLKYKSAPSVNLHSMDGAIITNDQMSAAQKRNITQVINDYSKRLRGFIRKRVANDADAEDVLQDVFYQLIGNTQPIEQLTSWLFTVTRNKITDRKRKLKPELIEDIYTAADSEETLNWTDFFPGRGDDPESEYIRNLFWEALNNALNELPEEQKKVFVLNELEGIPFKVIAEETGETINTLISRKRYAVLHLRERLQILHDELLNY